jgi:hypothetical protein
MELYRVRQKWNYTGSGRNGIIQGKTEIEREEVAAVSPNMLQRAIQNFQKRLGECVDNK